MTINFREQAVSGVQKLQPYQPGKPVEELERELGISNIIKLASNENPLGISPKALAALQKGLSELAIYPDGAGFNLKQALARKFGVNTNQITLGNGSNDILELITRAYLDPNRGVVMSEHAFAVYYISSQAVGAQLQIAQANPSDAAMPYGHNLDNMLHAIQDNTAVLFLANPNNPTGTWFKSEELYHFLKQVPERVVVVLDEAYTEYVTDTDFPDALPWLKEFPNLIITRTFSKIYGMAALRVGYALSSPDIADMLNRVRQPFNVNSLALLAAEAALGDDEHLQRSKDTNTAGLKQWQAACAKQGWEYVPTQGNFITINCERSGVEVFNALLREGVIVRPIANYGMPNYVRITVGTPEQNERCIAALAKVLKA
ncbi:histidinol-phosphate transaminase [Thiofilum flexile]|uniref:histidinol-phosphate transaminase n=1 Tax=Thiofilum flexile TaxID=125627 RepID=UPI00036C2745|nr:histidinol-phosphate transaminase [Thiofilum flexile]